MRSQLLILSKITLASMFIVGCGGGSDSPKDTTEYDLSQYLVPSKSQTNVYQEFTYEKKDGEQSYTETRKYFSNEKYDVNGSNITISISNEISETVAIEEDIIIRTFVEEEGNETMESVRSAKVGDTLIKTTRTIIEDGVELEIDFVCKLSSHLDEKNVEDGTYEDVLFVNCTQDLVEKSITLNGVQITVSGSGTVESYFAKDIGLISYADESCKGVTVGSITTTDCYKEESNLITIVEQ